MIRKSKSLFSSRVVPRVLIGTGLIALGIMMILLLAGNSASAIETDFSTVPVSVNFAAPELNLQNLEGKPASLDDYLGKVVLVNLWATWCPPCREEMPTLQKFYEKFRDQGFVLIAINQEETLEVVLPFVMEFGLTFPVWLDAQFVAQREFNTMSLPSSYVIDRHGRVRLMWIGGISIRNLEKYLPPIIKE
ncbi:MAG: redoxin domain-containing protein [Anaerolineaceae bacterium]|nr:redoxin domain-containing protein [Anaerolineaceae bacterium]